MDISGISMYEIMIKISNFLDCSLKTKIKKLNGKEFSSFTVTTCNKKSNQIMINYLNYFHLLTSKYLDFKYFFPKGRRRDLIIYFIINYTKIQIFMKKLKV